MAKERIEKTLIVLDEKEVRQLLEMAKRNNAEEIKEYMFKVFIKKVELVLRRRCS
ncbi:MAG: hypothetical protein ACPL3P_07855 [Anaerolineales bacterium]